MKMDNKLLIKKLHLEKELENSIKQIIAALKELQITIQKTSYYFIAFQLLANGIERLLKCAICYGYLHKKGTFPNIKKLKNHDITGFFKNFIDNYFTQDRQVTKEDYLFLTENNEAIKLINLLSEFAKSARYYDLDIVTDNPQKSINIYDMWNKVELDYIMDNPNLRNKLFNEPDFEAVNQSVSKHLVSIFEKIARAIVRQFTLGDMGEEPKKYIGHYYHFSHLRDNDIGTTDYYKKFYTTEIKNPKPYIDNGNSKNLITTKDYKKIWPFKNTDQVIVEKSNEGYLYIIINNKMYALNGITSIKLNIPFPHDLGEAYIGRSIGDFIEIAQNL